MAERAWPLSEVAGELGAHVRTVRDRLDRYGLRRQQPTPRQTAGHRRATGRRQARWQAKRQARLAMLGFATLEAYLAERRVEQGWPIRRIRAELHVDKAWLKHQMNQLEIP